MNIGMIYVAINKNNKESYVGQTIMSLEKRIVSHYSKSIVMIGGKYKYNYKFVNALRKYNKEDWEWYIIEDNIPYEKLNKREKYYVKKLDTYNNGYNSTEGGEINPFYGKKHSEDTKKLLSSIRKEYYANGNNPNLGRPRTDETKDKLRKSHTGKKHSEDTKIKISIANSGENHPMYNKSHSEETINKMRKIKLGKKHSEESKAKMSISRKGKKRGKYKTKNNNI